jgi:hypothetical protein
MYITNSKTIVLELGGITIKESILKNIKEELDLKTDEDVERHIQTIADGVAMEYLERFED